MMRQLLIRIGIILAVATGLMLDPRTLITGIITAVIGSLVTAVILRAVAHWREKRDVPYGDAYLTMTLAGIANLLVSIVLRFAIRVAWNVELEVDSLAVLLAMIPLGFVIQAGIIGARLRITFARACLVGLVMMAIALVMSLAVGVIAYVLMRTYRWERIPAHAW
jgi:hypothetical protein